MIYCCLSPEKYPATCNCMCREEEGCSSFFNQYHGFVSMVAMGNNGYDLTTLSDQGLMEISQWL